MGSSAYYHNNLCISESKMYQLRKFDLAGIAIMISGSATPPFYYTYMCKEQVFYQKLYLGLAWVSSLIALYVTMHPSQRDFKNRWVLAVSFIAAAFCSAPGLLHPFIVEDNSFVRHFPAHYFIVGGAVYIFGAILYTLKWPEKKFPGKFDNFGNSHNIFHVCVLIGALIHWCGSIKIFHERQLYSCPL